MATFAHCADSWICKVPSLDSQRNCLSHNYRYRYMDSFKSYCWRITILVAMGLSGISAPIRFVFISDVTSLTRPPPKKKSDSKPVLGLDQFGGRSNGKTKDIFKGKNLDLLPSMFRSSTLHLITFRDNCFQKLQQLF